MSATSYRNINIRNLLTDDFLKEQYVKLGKSSVQISKEFGICKPSVLRRLRKLKLVRPLIRYKVNHNFFDKWSNEMAWVLGFMISDGCIYNNVLTWHLATKDRDILDKINLLMQSNYPINFNKSGNGSISLSISSPKMVQKLEELGVSERKSLSIKWNNKWPPKYYSSLIRGIWDGDGCVRSCRNKGNVTDFLSINVVGTKSIVCTIRKILIDIIGPNGNMPTRKNNIYSMTILCNKAHKVMEWLYAKSTSATRLDRKYDKYMQIKRLRDNSEVYLRRKHKL